MTERTSQQRSRTYYRLVEWARGLWIYALLLGGAAIFAWPFLWMATTSVKVDREMFGESLRLMPERPIPRTSSPYIEPRHFQHVQGDRLDELLPILKERLAAFDDLWPVDSATRAEAIDTTARGVFNKLRNTLPIEVWDSDQFAGEIGQHVDRDVATAALRQARRALLFGQLRARSYALEEDQLVAPDAVAATWEVEDGSSVELIQQTAAGDPHAEMHYTFSELDESLRLSRTFNTSFTLERDSTDHPTRGLYRLQFYLRNDDTWHRLTASVEKGGVLYRAERPYFLSDYSNWGVVTWQEPGPDDLTNKIRNWILLREVDRGSQYESRPQTMKVVLELTRNSQVDAWWAKVGRNYQLALDHIPFWRYVATSVFLVILNLAGTLFSCSLVAYSFARLQWPGRGFCFALMLATMMIPPQVTMIPHFLIIRALGWYNTLYPLWVGSLFAGAFNVFLLRQFLKGIPRDLEDAAKIDGCGFWRIYWYVMLPLVKPTLAAIGIFTFMGVWNEFMGPLIYLTDQRLYPLSLGLYAFNVQAGSSMSMMMAGSLLMTVPVIVIFFFAQKYFIQGVTLTGMKG